jgi:outer membrane receptor protein involved in Fe transport
MAALVGMTTLAAARECPLRGPLVVGTRLTLVDASQYFPTSEDSGPTFAPTAAYALVDLFGSYNDDISANLTVKNLLNKYYIQYLDTLPNPGLTVVGSIIVRFASRLRPGEVIARPNFGFGRASAT